MSGVKEKYEKEYEKCEHKLKENKESACSRLDMLRESQVNLRHEQNKCWGSYFCWRDWPCLFTDHYHRIQEMQEKLAAKEEGLKRDCEAEKITQMMKSIQNNSSSHHAGDGNSYHNGAPVMVSIPKLNTV